MASVAAHPDRRRVTTAQAPAGEPPAALLAPPHDTDTSRAIGVELGRDLGTISRELRRNRDPDSGQYRPFTAQRIAAGRWPPGPGAASWCAIWCCGSWCKTGWRSGGARSRLPTRCAASPRRA